MLRRLAICAGLLTGLWLGAPPSWYSAASAWGQDQSPPAATEPAEGDLPAAKPAENPPAGQKDKDQDDHGHAAGAADGHDHGDGKHDHADHGDKHADDHGAGHGDGHGGEHGGEHGNLGEKLALWTILPFALLLLSIAVFPLANPHWWEHNSSKAIIAAVLGIPTALYLLQFGADGIHKLEHSGKEYVSFLLLLGSLFVISGGIYVRGTVRGTPFNNFLFLALGAAIASFVGTTGASMLLIRPLLRANSHRTRVAHIVVFFIFIVSNCGGLLTPLGDPPLFLGFLSGVPFEWTLKLFPQWVFVNGLLLVVFYFWDSIVNSYEAPSPAPEVPLNPEPFGLLGVHNFVFLAAVVFIIYASGQGLFNGGKNWPWGVGELLMAIVMVASFVMTPSALREKNRFSFAPILEVAILFAGIFVTMIPALAILNVRGKDLGVTEPWQYFWASGILSSFLDNAPTYLTFASTACGIANIDSNQPAYLRAFLQLPEAQQILAAISCGAVFMGANTYIGNGPNFMVKAIAEENNVKMPGFFDYMLYSVGILIPIFVGVTFVFFR